MANKNMKYKSNEEARIAYLSYQKGYYAGIKKRVEHGHWIVDTKYGNDIMSGENMVICSVCDKGIFWGKQDYCPHCGAKMDEVEE